VDPVLDRRVQEIQSLLDATEELAAGIAEGLAKLYVRILLYFRRRNPGLAEDCAQETMLRAFRLLIRQDVDEDEIPPFVFRIATFVAKEACRDRLIPMGGTADLEPYLPEPWLRRHENQPESDRYREQLRAIIHECLAGNERELLHRYYVAEEDRQRIADSLHISLTALRLRVFRVRKKLRDALEERLGPGGGSSHVS
jgi:RNA polymerase sigma factor (sigma-70 family)